MPSQRTVKIIIINIFDRRGVNKHTISLKCGLYLQFNSVFGAVYRIRIAVGKPMAIDSPKTAALKAQSMENCKLCVLCRVFAALKSGKPRLLY